MDVASRYIIHDVAKAGWSLVTARDRYVYSRVCVCVRYVRTESCPSPPPSGLPGCKWVQIE